MERKLTTGVQEMKFYVGVWMQVMLAGVLLGSAAQELDPEVLLEGYNLCNREFETISYDLGITVQTRSEKFVYALKHCSSNEKKQWIGRMTFYKEDGTIYPANNSLIVDICDENRWVHLQNYSPDVDNKRPPQAILLEKRRDQEFQESCNMPELGGPLTGRIYGHDHHSVYDLLKGATDLKSHNKVIDIIGHDTYLIEADTKYGVVRAWISPDLDYSCLKWEIVKDRSQYYRYGKPVNDEFTEWTASYDAEKVEQIDGQYFVTQAKFNHKVKDGDIVLANSTFHYNLKNIDFNPDYETLGAFKIQLPEGTVVEHDDIPGIQFRWTNGKFVPNIDDYLIQNLTGKPLPDFNMIKTDFDLEQAIGKRILVCFWDMNQRPSRNCMIQLAKQVEQLKSKSVIVVAVQASKVDEKTLNEWVKKNNIAFPVGMIQGDDEKVRLTWGVKSLPWLILTDRKYVVCAEGFSLTELDEKLL